MPSVHGCAEAVWSTVVVGSRAAYELQQEIEAAGYAVVVHNLTNHTEEYRTCFEEATVLLR